MWKFLASSLQLLPQGETMKHYSILEQISKRKSEKGAHVLFHKFKKRKINKQKQTDSLEYVFKWKKEDNKIEFAFLVSAKEFKLFKSMYQTNIFFDPLLIEMN